jgi:hypothetical protein
MWHLLFSLGHQLRGEVVSKLVSENSRRYSRFQGVYIEVKGYILNQGYSGYPNLSAVARARPTVKYGSDTT